MYIIFFLSRNKRIKLFLMAMALGIQMNQKELTKTFMMIANCKNPLICMVYINKISALIDGKVILIYPSHHQSDTVSVYVLTSSPQNVIKTF